MRKSLLSPASNKLSRPDAGIFIWDLFGLDGEEEVGKKIGVEDNCYGKKVKIVLFCKRINILFPWDWNKALKVLNLQTTKLAFSQSCFRNYK